MKARPFLLPGLLCLFATFTMAQYTAVKPGQSVPRGLQFELTTGNAKSILQLDSYRDQPLVIAFWGTTCADCLAEMPELEEFIKKYGAKMHILLVTKDSEQKVKKLINDFSPKKEKVPWLGSIGRLPMIFGDTILYKLFPHDVVPIHTWLSRELVLKGSAYATSTYQENLERLINNQPFSIDEMEVKPLDLFQPVQWIQYADKPEYSFFSGRIEYGYGISGPELELSDSITRKLNGISCINRTRLELYKVAYREELTGHSPLYNNRVVAPPDFIRNSTSPQSSALAFKWAAQHVFCYGMQLLNADQKKIYERMRKDLDQFFGYKSQIEKVEVECIVFKDYTGKPDKSRRVKNMPDRILLKNSRTLYVFYEVSDNFRPDFGTPELLNEATERGDISVDIRYNKKSSNVFEELNEELNRYGLQLVKEKRMLPMLVIKNK